jgi:mono/diheme cytochrome c family protein
VRKRIIAGILSIFLAAGLFAICISTSAERFVHSGNPISDNLSFQTEQGQALFQQNCSGCHTIGGGRLVGPDLKGVTDRRQMTWLVTWITGPAKVVASGDPIATQLVQEYGMTMPTLGLSQTQIGEILSYIEAQSPGKPGPVPTSGNVTTTPILVGESVAGSNLFTGRTSMANGAAACISCHNVNGIGFLGGGTVGKDLTKEYLTLGEPGIISIMKDPPFPMMKENFANRPLTDGEIADIIAFLKEPGNGSGANSNTDIFVAIGAGGALFFIAIFALYWRRRLSGVRRSLIKGASK